MDNKTFGKRRGFFAGIAGAFQTLILVMFGILVLVYTGYTLATALNNTNATLIWNNTVSGIINFTGQLGTVGTISGVMLLLALIGGALYFGSKRMGGSGGLQ